MLHETQICYHCSVLFLIPYRLVINIHVLSVDYYWRWCKIASWKSLHRLIIHSIIYIRELASLEFPTVTGSRKTNFSVMFTLPVESTWVWSRIRNDIRSETLIDSRILAGNFSAFSWQNSTQYSWIDRHWRHCNQWRRRSHNKNTCTYAPEIATTPIYNLFIHSMIRWNEITSIITNHTFDEICARNQQILEGCEHYDSWPWLINSDEAGIKWESNVKKCKYKTS